MARRFFVNKENIKGDEVILLGQEHFHISKVLRLGIGDEILISTDNGYELQCVISKINKDCTICNIKSKTKIDVDVPNVTLFQALMKNEHMDLITQKSTELNIKTLVPFMSSFVVVKPDDKKIERLQRISIEACKQSNRAIPMEITDVLSFKDMLNKLKDYNKIILAYENSRQSAREILKDLSKEDNIAIIVGCEGGFSESEVNDIKNTGAEIISLGKNILRGETASITLSSIVMYQLDEFK